MLNQIMAGETYTQLYNPITETWFDFQPKKQIKL